MTTAKTTKTKTSQKKKKKEEKLKKKTRCVKLKHISFTDSKKNYTNNLPVAVDTETNAVNRKALMNMAAGSISAVTA